MSASASLLTSVGQRLVLGLDQVGGALPALVAVSSLVTSRRRCACLLTVTWMSGCAAFQVATTLSMFGAQVQNVRLTFSCCWVAGASAPEAVPESLLEALPEQPASSSAAPAARAASRSRGFRRITCLLLRECPASVAR